MIDRLTRGCVVLVCLSMSVLMSCGDDEGSSAGSSTTAGKGTPDAGHWVNQKPVPSSGTGTNGGAGRRGILGGQMCPMTEAEATGSCTPARGSCMFGERTCDCSMETMSWACWAPSDCPTAVPAEQSACSVVGMVCPQQMRGRSCTCTQQGWDCGNQFCPPAEPALGSACEEGTGSCTYGARTCDCNNELWVCWDPKSDCPAMPPADRATCSLDGVVCEYEGGSCECRGSSGWRCGRGVMNDVEDAGVPPAGNAGSGAGGSTAGTSAAGGAGASAGGAGASGSGTSGAGAGANAGVSGAP